MKYRASIIIPVYNNAKTVKRAIEEFQKQTVPFTDFEIILVDDLSTDGLEGVIADQLSHDNITLIKNSRSLGAGGSRNRGLDLAKGEIVIFSDSDTVPELHFIEEHLLSQNKWSDINYVVLGKVADPPEMEITPLMRLGNVTETWEAMEKIVWDEDDWIQFRTTNVSLKKEFVNIRFDEKMFHLSGIEDTEFGYRLFLNGMKLVYNDKALSWHYHFRSPEGYLRKVQRYGELFARWEHNSDPDTAAMLNEKFNYLLDCSRPLCFKNLREITRRSLINNTTAPVIRSMGFFFKKRNEKTSLFFFNKLYKYLFLKGYKEEKRRLSGEVI